MYIYGKCEKTMDILICDVIKSHLIKIKIKIKISKEAKEEVG